MNVTRLKFIVAACLIAAILGAAGVSAFRGAAAGVPADPSPQGPPPTPKAENPAQPASVPLGGPKGAVRAVAFSPDGKSVATAGPGRTVRVWDVAGGKQRLELEQPGEAVGVAFAPDGKTIAATSTGGSGWLVLWDATGGKELWRSAPKERVCGAVAFSANGKRVAAGFGPAAVLQVEAPSGQELYLTRGMGAGPPPAVAFFAQGGYHLAVGDDGGGVHLLDPTSNIAGSWRGPRGVLAVAFLPGGTKVAAADGGRAVRILDLTSNKEATAFEATEDVRAVVVSPDGKRVATAGKGGVVRLWDAATGKQERMFSAATGSVNAVAFAPDGGRLVTAGEDGVAVIWDLTRDEQPPPADLKLSEKELAALWEDLASDEGVKVYAAQRTLRADPTRSVPFLQRCLAPRPEGADDRRIKRLIAELDADEFAKRESATQELEKLGGGAESLMRAALAAGPSPEARRRLERILKPLGAESLTPERRRDVRAVRVLELAGTPEAKALLEALAKESCGWWVTEEARAALERLGRRGR